MVIFHSYVKLPEGSPKYRRLLLPFFEREKDKNPFEYGGLAYFLERPTWDFWGILKNVYLRQS